MTPASCGLRRCVVNQRSAGLRAGCACRRATNLRSGRSRALRRVRARACVSVHGRASGKTLCAPPVGVRIVREAARMPPTVWCTTQNGRRHDAAGFAQSLRAGGPHMNSKRASDGWGEPAGCRRLFGVLGLRGSKPAGRRPLRCASASLRFRRASAHLKSGAGRTAGAAYVTATKHGHRTPPRLSVPALLPSASTL